MNKRSTIEEAKAEALRNPEFRKEYEALEARNGRDVLRQLLIDAEQSGEPVAFDGDEFKAEMKAKEESGDHG